MVAKSIITRMSISNEFDDNMTPRCKHVSVIHPPISSPSQLLTSKHGSEEISLYTKPNIHCNSTCVAKVKEEPQISESTISYKFNDYSQDGVQADSSLVKFVLPQIHSLWHLGSASFNQPTKTQFAVVKNTFNDNNQTLSLQKQSKTDLLDRPLVINSTNERSLIERGFPKNQAYCELCERSFSSGQYLKVHFKYFHTGDKQFICRICEERIKYLSCFKSHLFIVHKKSWKQYLEMIEFVLISFDSKVTDLPTSIKPLSKSSKKESERWKMNKSELSIDVNSSQMQCPTCGRNFVNKYTMREHIEAQHQGKRYPCAICNQQLKYKSTFTNHVKQAHDMNMRIYRQFISSDNTFLL